MVDFEVKVMRLHLGASQPHQYQKPVRHWAAKSCQDEPLARTPSGTAWGNGSEARNGPKPLRNLVIAATVRPPF